MGRQERERKGKTSTIHENRRRVEHGKEKKVHGERVFDPPSQTHIGRTTMCSSDELELRKIPLLTRNSIKSDSRRDAN
jgi:hypothetical protein